MTILGIEAIYLLIVALIGLAGYIFGVFDPIIEFLSVEAQKLWDLNLEVTKGNLYGAIETEIGTLEAQLEWLDSLGPKASDTPEIEAKPMPEVPFEPLPSIDAGAIAAAIYAYCLAEGINITMEEIEDFILEFQGLWYLYTQGMLPDDSMCRFAEMLFIIVTYSATIYEIMSDIGKGEDFETLYDDIEYAYNEMLNDIGAFETGNGCGNTFAGMGIYGGEAALDND